MAAAGGRAHGAAVGEDGALFVWGDGHDGQLGTGDTANRLAAPMCVDGLPAPVRQVAAGACHAGIVTDAGDLLMRGNREFGKHRATPTLVARALFDGEAMLMVDCGAFHSAALTEGGGVYTFGDGQDGLLGHGDFEDQLVPRRMVAEGFNDERVVMLAVREAHMVALSEEGHVFTWGAGDDGQLGHGDGEDQLVPRQVEPERFGGERVVFVAAGGDHTVAVTAGGRLYTWGDGHQGQLGHGSHTKGRDHYRQTPTLVWAGAFGGSAVMMAACGEKFTLVVTRDLTLWACGCGYDGQLGLSRANQACFQAGAVGEVWRSEDRGCRCW